MRPMTSLINIFRILGNLTKALQTIYFKTTKHLNSFVSHCRVLHEQWVKMLRLATGQGGVLSDAPDESTAAHYTTIM